jgi:hypothetical protein
MVNLYLVEIDVHDYFHHFVVDQNVDKGELLIEYYYQIKDFHT